MTALIASGLWSVYCVAYVAAYGGDWSAESSQRFLIYVTLCSVSGLIISVVSWRLFRSFWISRATNIEWRLILGVLAAAAGVAACHALGTAFAGNWVFLRPPPFKSAVITDFISFYFIYCMVYVLGVLTEAMRRDIERRERLALAESRAQQALLMALRLQINPHFLFNALNAVTALISTRRAEEALETVRRLGQFLRTVTETSPHDFSPLSEELEMAEEYLSIEAVRFGDRLETCFDVSPEAIQLLVPNFILQPLFENAVKHGVGATASTTVITLTARINANRLAITVENQAQDPAVAAVRPDGLGVGLRNIRERLAALYGSEATLQAEAVGSGFKVTLAIPARAGQAEAA